MALERLRFFGPQKARELAAAGLQPLDVLQDPSRLTIGGTRLESFRTELARLADDEWPSFLGQATRQLDSAAKYAARILLYDDPDYPPTLMASAYPIPILYVRGLPAILRLSQTVACVGSRGIREPYTGLHRAFAQAAVAQGFVVVSGFALGADTVGHSAALEAGGKTIGVMAGGLDRPFPPENKGLWGQLLEYSGAAFVSESGFGTRASSMTLRKRNKLIVGMSRGVLVSQSSAKGGAMNAYRFASEERKNVATFESDRSDATSGNDVIAHDSRVAPMVFGLQATPSEYGKWLDRLVSWI